jgi:hypothetical protein
MKKVFKYGTGDEIPKGAVYLCTKVQTKKYISKRENEVTGLIDVVVTKNNELVWHYFLVET